MKKYLLIITTTMGFILQSHAMEDIAVERLPSIAAFQEFNVDGGEFIPEDYQCQQFPLKGFFSSQLQVHCSKLNNDKIVSNSIKDIEILKFARDMVTYEKEWTNWHTIDKCSYDNKINTKKSIPKKTTEKSAVRKHFLETTLYIPAKLTENNTNETIIKIRRDENSPYYQWASTNDSNIVTDNLMENEAYHNELKFLQTQLRKMDLYWNIKSDLEKKLQCKDFNKIRNTLEQEIELFKKNRVQFTHSCLKSKDFENLQSARNEYNEYIDFENFQSTYDEYKTCNGPKEGKAYSEELMFLYKHLKIINDDWDKKTDVEKTPQYEDFSKTRNLLEQEIELLKKNRILFTHSYLKSTDFESLQSKRITFKTKKIWDNLPWYKKIIYYWNPSLLNPDNKIFDYLKQKHQLTRDKHQLTRDKHQLTRDKIAKNRKKQELRE